jgi:hypothetical protein
MSSTGFTKAVVPLDVRHWGVDIERQEELPDPPERETRSSIFHQPPVREVPVKRLNRVRLGPVTESCETIFEDRSSHELKESYLTVAPIEHPFRFFVIFVIVVPAVFCWVTILLVAARRGRRIPICPICGRSKVHRSSPKSFVDHSVRMMALSPFRCRGCLTRFYAVKGKRKRPVLHIGASNNRAFSGASRAYIRRQRSLGLSSV